MNGSSMGKGRTWWVFLFFLCAAIFITWPLLPNITSSLYGKVGDPLTTVWSLKWFKEAVYHRQGTIWHFPYAAYPHGIRTSFSLIYFPLIPLYAMPHGETVLYNLIIILSIALNGYAMYLLGRKLYGRGLAAFGMGLVYAFCPYALARATYHLSLVPVFIFPLLLYALINLKEDFTAANKAKAFFALLLAFNVHPYYTAMALLLLAVLSACYLARRLRRGVRSIAPDFAFIRVCVLLCLLALVITLPLAYIGVSLTRNSAASVGRQEGDLYTYAGHAWNYLVPSPESYFLGPSVQDFVRNRVLSTNIEEFVLFLGYGNLGLALIAAFLWFTRKRLGLAGRLTEDLEGRSWAIPLALVAAAAFFIWSLPPTVKIGGVTLYLPAWFTYRLVPAIRVYARFGVLVFFSVTVLSGACLACLEKALQKRREFLRYLLFFLLFLLLVSEFVEPVHASLLQIYDYGPIYAEVRNLPDDTVIVEYPFVAPDEAYSYQYEWNAIYHRKGMLNGHGPGTEGESMRNCVLNLGDEKTPGLLSYMGADYVVVHKDLYEQGSEFTYPPTRLDLSSLPRAYEMVAEDEDSALLRVNAPRPETVVIYDPKFSTVITPDFGNGWWLGAEKRWMIKIDSRDARTVDISFDVFSARGERTLRIDAGGGRVESFLVGEDARKVTLEGVDVKAGINRIYLSTGEDPTPYKEVFGGYDAKGICFAMSFWDVR